MPVEGSEGSKPRVVIVGGGAAGFFAAIRCAELAPSCDVLIIEKRGTVLDKVRISGGGRCNVTHSCFDARELSRRYPRGGRALIGPFTRFGPTQTVAWFSARGVELKTEPDGRMFPVTNTSSTIVDCLLGSARDAGVQIFVGRGLKSAEPQAEGGVRITCTDGSGLVCDALVLAPGGARAAGPAIDFIRSVGHTAQPAVPSLFTFDIHDAWVRDLAGLTVADASASIEGSKLVQQGPILFTHWGLSGPAILRLSAWAARELAALNYNFRVRINWLGTTPCSTVINHLNSLRSNKLGARTVCSTPAYPLALRLWQTLADQAKLRPDVRWSAITREEMDALAGLLTGTVLAVSGKSLNKDEFVTCGGLTLREVDFRTMESRICPRLHFAGEFLDIDGITGGYNFQAAWTTGWIAGTAIAEGLRQWHR